MEVRDIDGRLLTITDYGTEWHYDGSETTPSFDMDQEYQYAIGSTEPADLLQGFNSAKIVTDDIAKTPWVRGDHKVHVRAFGHRTIYSYEAYPRIVKEDFDPVIESRASTIELSADGYNAERLR